MHAIKTLSPEEVAAFLLQVVVLLAFAHVGGELMRRCRQPALIGNIFGGMLLGPSVLGHWFPGLQEAVFRPEQSQADMLAAITWVGLLLFLMEAGFEVRLDLLRRNAAACVIVSTGGLLVPMVGGFLLGQYLPATMLVHPNDRLVLSLFLAVSMSISALPPLAMILRDKDMLRENVGQISLGAAMMDDVVAWILVGITTSLHVSGTFSVVSVAKSTGAAVLFLASCFLVGRPLIRRFLDWHNAVAPGAAPQLSLLIICGLAGSVITSWLGLESILGIFVAGILFGSASGLQKNAVHSLSLVVSSFLAPLYFGLAGLRLNIWSVYEGGTVPPATGDPVALSGHQREADLVGKPLAVAALHRGERAVAVHRERENVGRQCPAQTSRLLHRGARFSAGQDARGPHPQRRSRGGDVRDVDRGPQRNTRRSAQRLSPFGGNHRLHGSGRAVRGRPRLRADDVDAAPFCPAGAAALRVPEPHTDHT